MNQPTTPLALFAAALCMCLAAPSQSETRSERRAARAEGPPAQALYYLFTAESLDHPTGRVSARFEYRVEDRIVGTESFSVSFRGKDTALHPIPSSIASLSLELEDGKLWVFADDLLVNTFDRESLSAYNDVLRHTHRDEIRSVSRQRGSARRRAPQGPNKIYCQSPCGGGCGPNDDYDCDGVRNSIDNCTDHANSNQRDCDNDGYGDVCDGLNGIFRPQGGEKTCMTDKDWRWNGAWFEHHVEQRLVDVSSCNSPDRWNRRVRSWAWCGSYSFKDKRCCEDGIGTSIEQVGDSYTYWCSREIRNRDFCH